MRLLLDTNAFLNYLKGKLPGRVLRQVSRSQTELLVSVLTPWEIALKPDLSRQLSTVQFQEQIAAIGARILLVTVHHTEIFRSLPPYHADPFDRMLIAQALAEDCPVVTGDQKFPLYETVGLKVIWD